jgi:predicted nucleic acid-binding protein
VTFVDSNILLDLFTADPQWGAWSQARLEELAARGPLVINDIVYAEISTRFASSDDVDAAIQRAGLLLKPIPRQALFHAGKAFRRYRAAGGHRTGVLPGFFIGAHAEAARLRLLTRDARRYRTYFPAVELIAPE